MHAGHSEIGGRNMSLKGDVALQAELDWLDSYANLKPEARQAINDRRLVIQSLLSK